MASNLAAKCRELVDVPTAEGHLAYYEECDDPANEVDDVYHPKHDQVRTCALACVHAYVRACVRALEVLEVLESLEVQLAKL